MCFSTYKNIYSNNRGYIKTNVAILSGEKRIDVVALWDTGSTSSHISERLVKLLDLCPVNGKKKITYSHYSVDELGAYIVSMILPTNLFLQDFKIYLGKYDGFDFDIIIGMDIIRLGIFSVDFTGERAVFTFSHPSDEDTDTYIETELF